MNENKCQCSQQILANIIVYSREKKKKAINIKESLAKLENNF